MQALKKGVDERRRWNLCRTASRNAGGGVDVPSTSGRLWLALLWVKHILGTACARRGVAVEIGLFADALATGASGGRIREALAVLVVDCWREMIVHGRWGVVERVMLVLVEDERALVRLRKGKAHVLRVILIVHYFRVNAVGAVWAAVRVIRVQGDRRWDQDGIGKVVTAVVRSEHCCNKE